MSQRKSPLFDRTPLMVDSSCLKVKSVSLYQKEGASLNVATLKEALKGIPKPTAFYLKNNEKGASYVLELRDYRVEYKHGPLNFVQIIRDQRRPNSILTVGAFLTELDKHSDYSLIRTKQVDGGMGWHFMTLEIGNGSCYLYHTA